MKLDRLKIVDDITNQVMFSITSEEESKRIKNYFLQVKHALEEIKIPYCHKCDRHVQNDISYVKSILTDETLTDGDKYDLMNTDKISWESRCKFLKKALSYEYGYSKLSDKELFDLYVDFVRSVHEQYDPNEKNDEKKFLYQTVEHLDPDTMVMEDLMIEDEGEETLQIRGHCGYDSYYEDKMYGI